MQDIIRVNDLRGPQIAALIETHATLMLSNSPAESCHFLPLEGLKDSGITVWSMHDGEMLTACGALKRLGGGLGELKSMHTAEAYRGAGRARRMLAHIEQVARAEGLTDLYLETGASDGFAASRALYLSDGFAICGPFADYVIDPHSVFMHKSLA